MMPDTHGRFYGRQTNIPLPHRRPSDGSLHFDLPAALCDRRPLYGRGAELAEHDEGHICDPASGAYRDHFTVSSEANAVQRS